MKKMVTYTTRPIRNQEVNGIDYYFIKEEENQLYIQNFMNCLVL